MTEDKFCIFAGDLKVGICANMDCFGYLNPEAVRQKSRKIITTATTENLLVDPFRIIHGT